MRTLKDLLALSQSLGNTNESLSNSRSKILRTLERRLKIEEAKYLKDDGSDKFKEIHNKLANYNYERYPELAVIKFDGGELMIGLNREFGSQLNLTIVDQPETMVIEPTKPVNMLQVMKSLGELNSKDTTADILAILTDFRVIEIY